MNNTLTVVETSSLTVEKQIKIKEQEIEVYANLINKRDEWLRKPANQLRQTFAVINRDTNDMREKLQEMREDLKYLQSKV
jgi:uncharacterized coiled-coil DUF342 family protein